ncbi:ABC transporter transmembrane domain-containing protein, partial [Streptococcus suis]
SALFIIITTLSTMFALDWKLTSLIVLFLPVIFVLVDQYRKRSAPIVAKTRSLLSSINSKLAESIEGIRIIQAFSQEDRLKAEFEAINQEHLDY